jgi:hypothetical protein
VWVSDFSVSLDWYNPSYCLACSIYLSCSLTRSRCAAFFTSASRCSSFFLRYVLFLSLGILWFSASSFSLHWSNPSYVSLAQSIFPARSLDLVALLSSLQLVTALCKVAALRSSCAKCCFFLSDFCDFLPPPSRFIDPTHPIVSLARSIFPARSLDLVALLSSLQLVTALCKIAALCSSCASVNKDLSKTS